MSNGVCVCVYIILKGIIQPKIKHSYFSPWCNVPFFVEHNWEWFYERIFHLSQIFWTNQLIIVIHLRIKLWKSLDGKIVIDSFLIVLIIRYDMTLEDLWYSSVFMDHFLWHFYGFLCHFWSLKAPVFKFTSL